MVVMRPAAMVLSLCVVACGSNSPPAPDSKAKSPLEPRGIQEMKRVKQDVEKAQEAGLQRNDDAIDRAQKSEAVGRGAPAR